MSDRLFKINLKLLAVYAILTVSLLLIGGINEETFETLIFWSILFALIDAFFASLQPKVWKLVKISSIETGPIILISFIAILSGFIVSFMMEHLNLALFEESASLMPLFESSEYPLFYAIVFVAVFPAIFEELSFRGFVYDNLKSISGENSALWGSAFLFGLVHLSLLSIFWIVPFGLLLGYFRKKYGTIIYGIIGHFVHNSTTILIEYYNLY